MLDKAEDIADGAKVLDKINDGNKIDLPKIEPKVLEDVKYLDEAPPVIPKKKPKYNELKTKEPCFLAGTIVKTPKGNIEIEKLNIGNEVFVYDFKDSKIKTKKILTLYNNWTNRYFEIKTENQNSIFATSKHLFWVESLKKWIPANAITANMELKGVDNKIVKVIYVTQTKNIELPTYNLEVEDIHNYFVGDYGILVHNKTKPSKKFTDTTKKDIQIYEVYDTRTGETKYVGQTDKKNLKDRFKEHLKSKDTKKISRKKWKKHYDIRPVKKGKWTPYEAATWEQHYIEKNGGKAKLENGRNEITEKKYNEYGKDKYGHNPCP